MFYIEDGGQIGIGTTNPTARLHIESADDVVVRLKSTDNRAYIALSDNDTDGYISSENSRLSLGAYPNVHANNLNIDLSNNNVGIGTTSPNRKTHVVSSEYVIGDFVRSSGTNAYLSFQDGNTTASGYVGVGAAANDLVLRSGNVEYARLNGSGNFGIGTTSPQAKLQIEVEAYK